MEKENKTLTILEMQKSVTQKDCENLIEKIANERTEKSEFVNWIRR